MAGVAAGAKQYIGRVLPARNAEGGYEILQFIAAGGFAWVYRARAPSGDLCAVKIPHRMADGADIRFLREIKVLKGLPPGPHTVRYLDDGVIEEGGLPFLVMELIDGVTLTRHLGARRMWRLRDACELMRQVAIALAEQHRMGIANRDVKPGNIMITPDGSAKLIDFGVAKDAQGLLKLLEDEDILAGHDFAENIDRGLIVGSPEYMAPEQFTDSSLADPELGVTDTWTDVYSLGIIFHRLLTGRKLFPFTPTSAPHSPEHARELLAYIELRTTYSDDQLPRPPSIPDALWGILSRALRQDPRRRQRDANVFLAEIEQFLEYGKAVDEEEDEMTKMADVDLSDALNQILVSSSLAPGAGEGEGDGAEDRVLVEQPTDSGWRGSGLLWIALVAAAAIATFFAATFFFRSQ